MKSSKLNLLKKVNKTIVVASVKGGMKWEGREGSSNVVDIRAGRTMWEYARALNDLLS